MKNTRSNSFQDCLDQLRANDDHCIARKITSAELVIENAQLLNNLEVLHNELKVKSDSQKVEQIVLEKQGSSYLNFLEYAPIGYLTLNANGLILEANLLAATLLGVHLNRLLHSHLYSYMTPESADWHNLEILHLTQHNNLQNYEIEIIHENGSLRNLQVNALKMKSGKGSVLFHITLIDFSERKKAADQLQKEKEKRAAELVVANKELLFQNDEKEKRAAELVIANQELLFQNAEKEKRAAELVIANHELLFQNAEKEKRAAELINVNHELSIAAATFESQEVMMVTDADQIILRVNKAFSRVTGYSAEEAIGQTARLLNSGKQSKDFYANMWKCINTKGAWEGEIWNRRKDGDVYPEHLSITAVMDISGVVSNYVATLTDITMSQAAADEIKSLAFYDPLTLLPNRRLFLDRLKQALASSARNGEGGALLFLDLDHFKILNDSLGHDIGDLLLQQVAIRLSDCIRDQDTIARIGGDEFVVLLVNLSVHGIETAAQTKIVGEKIILALNQPYQLNSHTYYNTSSIGATLFNGQEVETEELLKQADIAMYQSKAAGRNSLHFFDPVMQEAVTARADLERELRRAIEQHEFQLYYQLQVESAGRPCGAEVLIRWLHPERGLISPYSFIPLAEETGLILPIGQWVLETACAQLKIWQQDILTKDLKLSINVSARQFHQADFIEQVLSAIHHHNINPELINLELTESMLVNNIDDIITKMNALSKIGILFSLDDFGTGYSSLQYLKMLPLDQLKIDQSFVRDISNKSSDRAIVRTIINMASSLDINVIAEGVETPEQRQFLFDNGCTNYQGYLFGKPMSINHFESMLHLSRSGMEGTYMHTGNHLY